MPTKARPSAVIQLLRQERIEFAKFHKNAEKQILPIVRKALKKSIAPVLAWVEGNDVYNVPVAMLIDQNVWRDMYLTIFQQIGMSMARKEYYYQRRIEGGANKASAIEFLIDVWSTTLRDYALTYTYKIQRELNDRTIEILTRALGEDYSLGIDRLGRTRLFEKTVNGLFKSRGLTISRTESGTIANLGKEIGARSWIDEQGGNGYKVWLGRNDERERPSHLQENNTIIPIDDYYNLEGDLALRPCDVNLLPKNRIQCRCTQSLMSGNRYEQYRKIGRISGGKII